LTRKQLFVYRPGAIGDTILTLPALAAMRWRFPGCAITYSGNSAMVPLLPVDEPLSADDPRLLPLFEEPPRPWPGTDLHVILARQPKGLPGIQREPLEALKRGVHVADWLVDAIDPAFTERTPLLAAEAGPGAELVLHPGAGSPAKRWPAQRFAELAEALGLQLAIVRGPADPPFAASGPHELWESLPLAELARRLKGSRLFAGNDSGISHLAAAVGTPALAIYVSTNPHVWGIRGAYTRRLAGAIGVEEALRACRELLAWKR